MSQLTVYLENDPATKLLSTEDFDEISAELGNAGIRIEDDVLCFTVLQPVGEFVALPPGVHWDGDGAN